MVACARVSRWDYAQRLFERRRPPRLDLGCLTAAIAAQGQWRPAAQLFGDAQRLGLRSDRTVAATVQALEKASLWRRALVVLEDAPEATSLQGPWLRCLRLAEEQGSASPR